MQEHKMSSGQASQLDQRNIIIIALIIIAVATAASFVAGFDLLVGIAWAFTVISSIVLMSTALWVIRNLEYYPMSASLPQRAKIQLIGSLLLSIIVIFLQRAGIYSLSPALLGLLQTALLAITAIQILALSNANLRIKETENNIQSKCQTLHTLQLDLEQIASYAKTTDSADKIRKLAEAVRYSDPVSNNLVSDIEKELQQAIDKLEQAVLEGDLTLVQSLISQATRLLDDRNRKILIHK